MKFCIQCGQELPDEAQYCWKCGAAQSWKRPDADAPAPAPDTPARRGGKKRLVPAIAAVSAVVLLALVLVVAGKGGRKPPRSVGAAAPQSTAAAKPAATQTPAAHAADDYWGEDDHRAWYPNYAIYFDLPTGETVYLDSDSHERTIRYDFPYDAAAVETLFRDYQALAEAHFHVTESELRPAGTEDGPTLELEFRSTDGAQSGELKLDYWAQPGGERALYVTTEWEMHDGKSSLAGVNAGTADLRGLAGAPAPTPAPTPASTPAPVVSEKKTGAIPDPEAFSGVTMKHYGVTEYSDYTKLSYGYDHNEKFENEYLALLEDYGFVLRGSTENSVSSMYVYDYAGKGGGTFSESIRYLDGSNIALWLHIYKTRQGQMDVMYADGFTVKDTGERTTRTVTMDQFPDVSVGGSASGGSTYEPNIPDFARQDCLTCRGGKWCPECGGQGYVYSSASKRNDRLCPKCHGGRYCPDCGGSGKR